MAGQFQDVTTKGACVLFQAESAESRSYWPTQERACLDDVISKC